MIYNYNKNKQGFTRVSEEDAERNFWTQMIVGDKADNVNYLKGLGPVYAKKHLEGASGRFSHIRRVYALFKEMYQENARYKFLECYRLLKIG